MGQAIQEVLDAADDVTASVYEDGAAAELRALRSSAPRLVATDLDGTLVRSDGTVSAATRELLADLDLRGVPVVFVTGRPLRWTLADVRHGLAIATARSSRTSGARHHDGRRPRSATVARRTSPASCATPPVAFEVPTAGLDLDGWVDRRSPVPDRARRSRALGGPARPHVRPERCSGVQIGEPA